MAIAACGAPDPEDALDDAAAELATAIEHRAAADAEVERTRERMRELEDELGDAERVAREAAAHVAEAEQRVAALATDDVLFRVVQRRLLEDGELADAAVRVDVAGRVATLRGVVPDEEARARAAEIARSSPGVVEVVNELRSTAPPSEG
ncbi:MAG: BON domain-containing protein [Myxococcota bacterium]